VLALVPILGNVPVLVPLACVVWLAFGWVRASHWGDPVLAITLEGTARGGRYCNARGEILRSLQDQLRRRRSASACSSIKNVSVGSEDDQTPS